MNSYETYQDLSFKNYRVYPIKIVLSKLKRITEEKIKYTYISHLYIMIYRGSLLYNSNLSR